MRAVMAKGGAAPLRACGPFTPRDIFGQKKGAAQ